MRLLIASIFFNTFSAQAATLVWDFSQVTDLESSTLVYNHHLEKLHPSLQIIEPTGAASSAIDFEVGDGSHGAFNSSTYSQFDNDGDVSSNEIIIDADDFPILQVTDFRLEQGMTLKSVNGPLIVYALGEVVIEGTIDCTGEDGSNGVGTIPGDGGEAYCGGGNGGDGGAVNSDGDDGQDLSGSVTGGRGGNTAGVAVAGGGGGSWHTGGGNLATNGANSSAAGGEAGNSQNDPIFSNSGGGAGGGGGSGTPTQAGAGGGAGGGQVMINAVGDVIIGSATNPNIGFILADGGDGGNSNVPGGAGGGGAGGSISIYSAGRVTIFNVDGAGASKAERGMGGSNSLAASGGNGGQGRSWFPTQDFSFVGFYTPAEEGTIDTLTMDIEYVARRQVAISRTYDLLNTRVSIDGISVSPSSSDFLVEVSGSEDNFVNDDSGWTTDLSLVAEKRYLKIRATILTSNTTDPDRMDSITINYSPGSAEEFEFNATSCAMIQPLPPNPNSFLLFLLPLLILLIGGKKLEPKAQ